MGFIEDFIAFLENLATTNPSLGIFIASLLGNLVPFFPVPYLFLVVIVAQAPGGPGLVQLATVGALGAAIGKFAIYGMGYGAGTAFAVSREIGRAHV